VTTDELATACERWAEQLIGHYAREFRNLPRAEVEDAFQSAVLAALVSCRSSQPSAIYAFLRTGMRFELLNALRRYERLEHRAELTSRDELALGMVASAYESVVQGKLLSAAVEVFAELPPTTREVYYLRAVEDRPPREIVEVTGLTPRQVKRHLERAKEKVAAGVEALENGELCAARREAVGAIALGGELDDDGRRTAERHLDHCMPCRALLAELRREAANRGRSAADAPSDP